MLRDREIIRSFLPLIKAARSVSLFTMKTWAQQYFQFWDTAVFPTLRAMTLLPVLFYERLLLAARA